jgi:hypothetical protein
MARDDDTVTLDLNNPVFLDNVLSMGNPPILNGVHP